MIKQSLPKTIKIGGHMYEIISKNRAKEAGDDSNIGRCDNTHTKIWIDNITALSQQKSTLLHETIEAINYHWKISLTEKQISSLEASLFQVFQDNKGLKNILF